MTLDLDRNIASNRILLLDLELYLEFYLYLELDPHPYRKRELNPRTQTLPRPIRNLLNVITWAGLHGLANGRGLPDWVHGMGSWDGYLAWILGYSIVAASLFDWTNQLG